MSGSEDRNQYLNKNRLNKNGPAFEYVAGTLPPAQRSLFEEMLDSDAQLQQEVRFWEEHFMGLQNSHRQLPPKPGVWEAIVARIGVSNGNRSSAGWRGPTWRWWIPGATVALLAALIIAIPQLYPPQPNTDYVAVLTDDAGNARLTALTTGRSQKMWLQWNKVILAEDTSLQLWATSRRDGQTRPIAVFHSVGVTQLSLSEAEWRLIKDAKTLLLTQEEAGGSPLNMPSDILVAKGVCVRFETAKNPKT